jgi:hypothetical protein
MPLIFKGGAARTGGKFSPRGDGSPFAQAVCRKRII